MLRFAKFLEKKGFLKQSISDGDSVSNEPPQPSTSTGKETIQGKMKECGPPQSKKAATPVKGKGATQKRGKSSCQPSEVIENGKHLMPVMSDTTLYQGTVVMDLDGHGSKRDSSSSEEGIRVLNSSDEEKFGEEILGIKLNDTSN